MRSSKHCFPSFIKFSMLDKSGFAGCALKDTKYALSYFRGCQVCSTITNLGLIQATAFSFENIVVFRRSNLQMNFLIVISRIRTFQCGWLKKTSKKVCVCFLRNRWMWTRPKNSMTKKKKRWQWKSNRKCPNRKPSPLSHVLEYHGFKNNVCIFDWPKKRKKKSLAMQLLSVHTRRTWPVNLVPVGTFRKRGRHNIRFNPLNGHIIANTHASNMRIRVIVLKLLFLNRFIVYVWTGENDAKTLHWKVRFQMNTNTSGRGLTVSKENICFTSLPSN